MKFKLKTLAKLVLIAGIGLGSLNLSAQDFKFPHETDKYKFIPKGARITSVTVGTAYGIFEGIWYNKDCKNKEEYNKKFEEDDEMIPPDEIFLDMDGDKIPDLSLQQLDDLYIQYLEEQELEKSSL